MINDENIHELVWNYINNLELPENLVGVPIGEWDVSNVTEMPQLFEDYITFNEPLYWDVSNVKNMEGMFTGCTIFNQPLDHWDVSGVENMRFMFAGCTNFNQPLNKWVVYNVENMQGMFTGCTNFNQPLNDWDVSSVYDMSSMFSGCIKFNQPLNDWIVDIVSYMNDMFSGCIVFNQPLNDWDVSRVLSMNNMFNDCIDFNQPLNNWRLSRRTLIVDMFKGCNISEENKPIVNQDNPNEKITINQWFIEQGIATYNTIQPAPLTHSNDTTVYFTKDTTEYDPIMMEDVNIYEYLNDADNIVVIYLNKIYFTSKSRLNTLCSDFAAVKYKCNAITGNSSNYDKTVPYLNGRSFGCFLAGLIEVSKVKTIIETPEIKVVKIIDFIPEQNALSTISIGSILSYLGYSPDLDRLLPAESTIVLAQSISSASHCQAEQDAKIQDIQILSIPIDTDHENPNHNNDDESEQKRKSDASSTSIGGKVYLVRNKPITKLKKSNTKKLKSKTKTKKLKLKSTTKTTKSKTKR